MIESVSNQWDYMIYRSCITPGAVGRLKNSSFTEIAAFVAHRTLQA